MWVREKNSGRKKKYERSDVGGCMGRKGNGLGNQSGGSTWAKKRVVLRTEIGDMLLFYNLFICVFHICFVECYLSW